MASLGRRGFLKSIGQGAPLAGVSLLGLDGAKPLQQDGVIAPPTKGPVTHWNGSPLGRVLLNILTEYKEPSWRAPTTGTVYPYDTIIPVLGSTTGEGLYHTNHTWLETDNGYVYASWVQPVKDINNNPVQAIGAGGSWGQISVPTTWGFDLPDETSGRRHKLYYSNVNRITAEENGFYYVEEIYGAKYWIKAAYTRIITPDELSPISSDVPPEDKRIELSLYDQRAWAYEGDDVVNEFRVATGSPGTPTPVGDWRVIIKRIGQRMTGGASDTFYNLPGIPYVCYINNHWVATHGCYWHNDYGRVHSNGCINLLPEDAKWIFRWTTPQAQYDTISTDVPDGEGTAVIVKPYL